MSQPAIINHTITTILGDDYLSVWIDAFLSDRKAQNLSKHSVRFYQVNLKLFSDYCDSQAVKSINQITSPFIREFFLYLESTGHNTGGINAYFRSIKAFLRWYWDEVEPDTKNPIDKVKPPKLIQEPITGISKDEFDLLLSTCTTKSFLGERDKTILLVLMDTGVRAEELCNIKLSDVNLVENSIFISQGKGRKPRTVFIGRKTRKQIRRYLNLRGKDGTNLFVNRSGERLIYSALRQIIRRMCEQAQIKNISLHDFRRGFTLECLRKGIDLLTISRLLGHASLQLLPRYAKQTALDLSNTYRSVVDD